MRIFLFYFLILTSIYSLAQNNRNTIGFTENKGQIVNQKGKENKSVLYLLNTPGLNVQLKKNAFSYDIYEMKKNPLTEKDKAFQESYNNSGNKKETPDYSITYNYHRIDIDFLNSNPDVQLIAEGKSRDYDNYYNVAHAPEGITNVHKYQKVTYKNLYNNIDAVFFIPKDSTKAVEYNFIVKPGGKISDIQLKFKGAETQLTDNKIKFDVRFGAMEETLPLSWTEQGNSRKEIAVGYKKIKKNVYGFDGDVDASDKTIVIDPTPVRLWGTYYGDQTNNYYTLGAAGLTTDSFGNAYMSGSTSASNSSYATSGAHQSSIPQATYLCTNGIIVKFDPNGNRLWGTYYGGLNYNNISDIKADSQNNIIITGITQSVSNISTTGSYKPNLTGYSDAFLVKFNESGIRIWGTYFGGEDQDSAAALAIDSSNNIYIVGVTQSLSGIAFNCNFQSQLFYDPQYGVDAFVAKFNTNGNLIWGTYAGGEKQDQFTAITVKNNYLVVGGNTLSFNNISTSGAFQQNHDINTHDDAMVYKFSKDGFRLWSTYYGGEYTEYISSIEVDDEDNIYFGGETGSQNNIATPGSFQSSNQYGYTGYLVKLNSNSSRLWGTFLGQVTTHSIIYKNNSIYIGATGNTYVLSTNLTNSCSYRQNGLDEGYIGKFSKSGELVWGTFVGGFSPGMYHDTVIAFDNNNDIFVSGQTGDSNTGIVDSNSYQSTILGYFNNYFIMKFDEGDLCSMNFQPTTNSPICTSQTISFNNIPSGYIYNWTGPNGFTSTVQNPTITNVNSSNSGLYTLVISDGIVCNCQKTYTFNIAIIADNSSPVPNIANLPVINGNCNTIISTIPTATDNCAGNITATTTSPLNYSTPGTYTIVWNYNDGNGNTITQNQTVIVTGTNTPIVNTYFYFCPNQTPSLSDITITGQNIKWYDAPTAGNFLANTTLLQNGTTYYASQTISSCESARVPVTVTIQNTPTPTGNANQNFCSSQNATLNDITISGTNIIWYSSSTGNTILPATTLLANNTVYYATQTVNGCESPTRLAVTVTLINTLNATNYSKTFCDDLNDSAEIVNLSDYNSNLIAATNGNIFTYYHSLNGAENQISTDQVSNSLNYNLSVGDNLLYVRIDSNNGCHQAVELNLKLVSKPIIPIMDIMPICEGSSIIVNAGIGFDSYLWSTSETSPSITVSTPGSYSVTVTQNHGTTSCSSVKNFTVVKSNAATVSEIITSDWTSNQNTMTVLLTTGSVGNYVYSLDNINYQESNVFTNLPHGDYTVYIKDKNGCGITPRDFYLLMFPNFFTPNGDGYNDYWKIELSEYEPDMTISIFDRYGKLLKELNGKSQGWDGTFLGNSVPSSDYWFVVKRQNGKEYRGHFSLKR